MDLRPDINTSFIDFNDLDPTVQFEATFAASTSSQELPETTGQAIVVSLDPVQHPNSAAVGQSIRRLNPGEAGSDDPPLLCSYCKQPEQLRAIVICDGCEHIFHVNCAIPPITSVDFEEWLCHLCLAAGVSATQMSLADQAQPLLDLNVALSTETEETELQQQKQTDDISGSTINERAPFSLLVSTSLGITPSNNRVINGSSTLTGLPAMQTNLAGQAQPIVDLNMALPIETE